MQMFRRLIDRAYRPSLRETGFSLVESSVFVGTAALLASAIATVSLQSVQTAKAVVAREDVEAIAAALGQLMIDHGDLRLTGSDGTPILLLAGDGEIPATGDELLGRAIDGGAVVALDDVLYRNSVGLRETDSPWEPGWRGPYLQPGAGNDPWGHRYAVRFGGPEKSAVFVLSAGPDGEVASGASSRIPEREEDDVLFLLSTGR